MRFSTAASVLLLGAPLAQFALGKTAHCPYIQSYEANKERRLQIELSGEPGDGGIPEGGYAAVKEALMSVFTDSQDFFPADFGNYGPLLVRLAWHCAGSYRVSDGRGGCDGARIRFDPEFNWPDNANLDFAKLILDPVKQQFGSSLSWGDLIVLAGTTAMEFMGFPEGLIGFCGGRIDEADGFQSLQLGPTPEQEAQAVCEVNGDCDFPLGPTTIGLIYINPAGPFGNSVPADSADDVRQAMGNMGFNDDEAVALIGGGHAFGKCHGGCPEPPCPEGVGPDGNPLVFTSGFELQWTTIPTTWSNEYFNNLLNFNFTLGFSPAEQPQWFPFNADGTPGPPNLGMLTSDLAFINDDIYLPLIEKYSTDLQGLEEDFAAAWYRLVSQDMGPETRCIGEFVRPPQPFQQPNPVAAAGLAPDFPAVQSDITEGLNAGTFTQAELIRLAFQCASTYRFTDFSGGCDGARIRFPPESEWPVNAGLDEVLSRLMAAVDMGDVSIADLIVMGGNTALEMAGVDGLTFCGGRTDAADASFSEFLAPRDFVTPATLFVRDNFLVMGLSIEAGIALIGRPTDRYPELGSLFAALVSKTFEGPDANGMFTPTDGSPPVTAEEFALTQDSEFASVVDIFNSSPATFLAELVSGWTQLMNADRFDGPTANICTGVDDLASAPTNAPVAPAPDDDEDDEDDGGEVPGVFGEPHFKSWSGTRYDYHGECDLVFVKAPKFDMDIHIRTTIRKHYSYVSSAVLRIGKELLEVQSRGHFILNGEEYPIRPDLSIAGKAITHTRPDPKHHVFEVDIGEHGRIVIKTYAMFVSVFIDSHSKDIFGDSQGLNGDFVSGKLLSRNGTEIVDPNDFGEEWQVRDTEPMLFQVSREPQYPQRCLYPEIASAEGRRRLSQEQDPKIVAEAHDTCKHLFENSDDFEACVFDVLATGDVGLADAGVF